MLLGLESMVSAAALCPLEAAGEAGIILVHNYLYIASDFLKHSTTYFQTNKGIYSNKLTWHG